MGVFGAVCRRSGDAGFIGPLLWTCSGVVGFNVAMFLRPVRDIFRPAWPGMGASAKKFAQHTKNGSKWVFYGALGELLRGNAAGGAELGELFRGNAAGGVVLGEFCRAPAAVGSRRASLLCRVPGTGALLLSVNPSMRS